jgi:hypothetical protein
MTNVTWKRCFARSALASTDRPNFVTRNLSTLTAPAAIRAVASLNRPETRVADFRKDHAQHSASVCDVRRNPSRPILTSMAVRASSSRSSKSEGSARSRGGRVARNVGARRGSRSTTDGSNPSRCCRPSVARSSRQLPLGSPTSSPPPTGVEHELEGGALCRRCAGRATSGRHRVLRRSGARSSRRRRHEIPTPTCGRWKRLLTRCSLSGHTRDTESRQTFVYQVRMRSAWGRLPI